jgi:autotransporter-associated beta strand protein
MAAHWLFDLLTCPPNRLMLQAANSDTGATTVNAGVLLVNGARAAAVASIAGSGRPSSPSARRAIGSIMRAATAMTWYSWRSEWRPQLAFPFEIRHPVRRMKSCRNLT